LLVAVQLHPFEDVTPTEPVPPAEPNEALVEEIEYVQGAPVCLTVKV
jgi:hypothetical protein